MRGAIIVLGLVLIGIGAVTLCGAVLWQFVKLIVMLG